MAKPISGYRTIDDRFFENEAEADYEDTKLTLKTEAERSIEITADLFGMFLTFIDKNAELVKTHCYNAIAFDLSQQKTVDYETIERELEDLIKGEIVNGSDTE